METIKIIDLTEFKRGMIGLLKILMFEAMQSQRLDHYAMYKTMNDIVGGWKAPIGGNEFLQSLMEEDEEAIARMILNFPKDTKDIENMQDMQDMEDVPTEH